MNAVEDLRRCLDLVAKDLCEAHAADRMRTNMRMREDRLAVFERSEVRFGLRFIEHALALRMMHAVNRTLQAGDKASFVRLLKLAKSADPNEDFSGLEARLKDLRDSQVATRLKECRDGFMAHTYTGERGCRDGMDTGRVADLLYDLTDLYEEIHRVATGTEDRVISGALEKWHARAPRTWDALLGVEDAHEGLLASAGRCDHSRSIIENAIDGG